MDGSCDFFAKCAKKAPEFLRNQDKLRNTLEVLDKEMRRMNKANRSLKNEKTTLQAIVKSKNEYIKDLENERNIFSSFSMI